MLYDANASIGHWPFRHHNTGTAAELLARMDEVDIDRALVASLSAVCYRDAQAGNEDMLAQIEGDRDRLTPVAVIDPTYAGWQRSLDACAEAGCVGVRLYPNYHRYALSGPDGQRLIGACLERDLLLCFVCRHEDRRQRHWMDAVDDIALADIAAALAPHESARFLILNGIGFEGSPFCRDDRWRERRFGLDLSRLASVMQRNVPKVMEVVGEDKIVFGTGLPLKGPNAALLKVRLLDERLQPRVGSGNLEALLSSTGAG